MTQQFITLPDGTQAVLIRSLTWGEAVIILLFVALVFFKVLEMWLLWSKRDS